MEGCCLKFKNNYFIGNIPLYTAKPLFEFQKIVQTYEIKLITSCIWFRKITHLVASCVIHKTMFVCGRCKNKREKKFTLVRTFHFSFAPSPIADSLFVT